MVTQSYRAVIDHVYLFMNLRNLLYVIDFFTEALPNRGYSSADLIHLNYPYNAENRDCWYQLSEDLKPALEPKQDKEKEHIYLVSVEEDEDEGE